LSAACGCEQPDTRKLLQVFMPLGLLLLLVAAIIAATAAIIAAIAAVVAAIAAAYAGAYACCLPSLGPAGHASTDRQTVY
jgi:hypothetical protein